MKNIFFSALVLAFIFQSCKKKDDSVSAPVACFTTDVTETIDSAHNFLFDQCPPQYDVSYWDFGDGQYSSNPNPEHKFNHYGNFNVKLTVTNTTGQSNSVTHTVTVGHYSLDKVVYSKLNSTDILPLEIFLIYTDSFANIVFPLDDTINSFAQIPVTHDVPDGSLYDLHPNLIYLYREVDSAFNFNDYFFAPNNSNIINKKADEEFIFSGDTSKFTLYFKIVPR